VEGADATTLPDAGAPLSCRRWEDRAVDHRVTAWAASGAMRLTGRPGGPPLGAPPALVDLVERAAAIVGHHGGDPAIIDGLALLGERAAIGHLSRHGTLSCGGTTRLVPAAEGWVAVTLARPEDIGALPAWLCRDVPADDPWPAVHEAVAMLPAFTLDERAALLGLPFAALGSVGPPAPTAFDLPVGAVCVHAGAGDPLPIVGAKVVDLSSLWAGPLCGDLLARAGASVVKVESTSRPDGARGGPAAFFNLLNGWKRSVAVDLATAGGRRDLHRLVVAADVVIESARPRALEQMGIVAADVLGQRPGPRVWASITSHGRGPQDRHRVGFGDVAAVAGGLVGRDGDGPCFLADAVADPLGGLVVAAAVLEALAAGGHWLIDGALAPLAASVAGPAFDVGGVPARPPRARAVARQAQRLGADTAAVLGGLDHQ
jgi:hypothetical protein